MSEITTIVFDFDGVIVSNSEFAKHAAWHEILAPHKDSYESLLKEAEEKFAFGRKGDRFDMLRHILTGLNVDKIEERISVLAAEYDLYVQRHISAEGVSDDVRAAIAELSERYSLYINSGTPETALKASVEGLGLGPFFKDILGRPRTKTENMKHIAGRESADLQKQVLLVGDSDADVMASEETRCLFVGVINEWNAWKQENKPFRLIQSVAELPAFLQ